MTPPKEIETMCDAVELGTIAHLNTGGIKYGEMMVVIGRSSTGKSRLFEAFLDDAKAREALKGVKDGNCNVTACQRPGATYFNKSTKKYYCPACAEQINWPGGRALTLEIYGVPLLCELDKADATKATFPEIEALTMTILKRRVSNDLFIFDELVNEPRLPVEKNKAQWKREINRGRRR